MKDNELREKADRKPTNCPECGYSGAFDGQGFYCRDYQQVTTSGREMVHERWYRFGCTECGGSFSILENEMTTDLSEVDDNE